MEVLNRKTRETRKGTQVTVSIIKTTDPIRPAKHTSLKDIRKMAARKKPQSGFLRMLGFK